MKGNFGYQRVATLIALAAAICFLTGTPARAQTQFNVLYGVNSADDSLSVIDPATGRVTLIGPLDPNNILFTTPVAMAVRPSDGKIFVWNNTPNAWLVTVDPCTGLGTAVSPAPAGPILGALAFSPQGDLYAADTTLFRIDPVTGVATAIGPIGIRVGGIAFDSQGVLYGVELTLATSQSLVTIDPTNGAGTVQIPLSVDIGRIGDLVFDQAGTLMGSGFGGPQGDILFDIDPTTGTVSNVRPISGGSAPQGMGFGPACVPPPQAQPLNPQGGTNLYKFQNNLYNYKVTYPAFSEPPANLVVQPILISQADLNARLAGQFPGATLVPYDGTGRSGVLFRATCQDSSGKPVTCPETSGPYDVKTSWWSGASISNPAFLMADIAPVGEQAWSNIFTAFSQTRIDPTGSGRTCCHYSDFVFVQNIGVGAPTITITTPENGATYLFNEAVAASYSCTPSPPVVSCIGDVANGSNIDTSSVESKTFTVNANVSAGPAGVKPVQYQVVLPNVCLLYDPNRSVKKGATFPIKLQVCDVAGHNLSSPSIVVQAVSVTMLSGTKPGALEDSGNANPDYGFRFDSTLGVGGAYIYNLSTKGLSSGTWRLNFTITGDPSTHSAQFGVK